MHWLGSARAVALCAPGSALGLAGAGLGYEVGVWLVAVALFVLGFTIGTWDVSMNVHAAAVEQRAGRAIMARFHAGYSVGSVVGAGLGALAILTHVPVPVHLCVMAVVVVLVVPWGARMFYPEIGRSDDQPGQDDGPRGVRRALVAWRERRTVLIGLVVLAFALAEGAGNDWVSVALVDDHGAAPVVGTLGLTAFLTAMTVGRWFGPAVLDRYGRVRTLRVQSVMLIVGVVLFVFGQVVVLAVAGALLWGVGVCLGFPVGMSAAADDPARAPARVSVVASIGYCAFLAGPPLLGFLGQHLTVSHALLAAAVLVAIATLVLGAVRPSNRWMPRPRWAPTPPATLRAHKSPLGLRNRHVKTPPTTLRAHKSPTSVHRVQASGASAGMTTTGQRDLNTSCGATNPARIAAARPAVGSPITSSAAPSAAVTRAVSSDPCTTEHSTPWPAPRAASTNSRSRSSASTAGAIGSRSSPSGGRVPDVPGALGAFQAMTARNRVDRSAASAAAHLSAVGDPLRG